MTQHVRITLEQAKDLYRSGVFNTTTLVLFFFKIRLAEHWTGKFTNQDIYEDLGISKASFYRTISFLRLQGLLFWQTTGVTEYGFNPDIFYGDDKPVKPSHSQACLISETDCLKDEIQCLKIETDPLNHETQSFKSETRCLKNENPTPLKPSPDKDYSPPTNLFQIYFNSLSPSLKGLSEDDKELNSFFEWWTTEMGNFPQPIRNPIAFLRSIDPNTGQERLVTQWLLWKQAQVSKKLLKRSYNDEWEKVLGLSATINPSQRTETIISDSRLLKATKAAGGLQQIGRADRNQLQKLKAAFLCSLKEQDIGHDD
jgi:hypothetical protein